MLVQPGTLISAAHAERDPILGLQNLNHYSDPSLSGLTFHSGVDLKEILPIKGSQKMEQPDPAYAMQYIPEAFRPAVSTLDCGSFISGSKLKKIEIMLYFSERAGVPSDNFNRMDLDVDTHAKL